ncbi:uncharacterized protein N7479_000467 [Penicillium vulpinum]|uniref:Uncharacterized protein n=1 Tax=Penicillium vulpinum TaxID=29845 RepID=A0A1V6S5B5_9EURO|nr:uncharacterized protein N7479_000467 [Penicillium vulpinum]KAJ5970549.1 hypothetical protein N7479_000467 [Penicillium vulpinum]OQE09235.1 hypothetical protein PENVUL_c007G05852 [Penicillium vulpinum]
MADPAQSHGRGAQNFPSAQNVRSPLSPGSGSGSGTPISFQTNVNRSKTKRWVEAKKYTYDGGDWGSDDDDEEEEEAPPPAVPRPPYATHNTGSSSELSSRRLSGIGFGAGESHLADGKSRSFSGGDQKPLPFVRPADLYKRMREEKTAQQPPITGSNDPKPDEFGAAPDTSQESPALGLPEVRRMSGFGTDFLDGADANLPKDSSTSQEATLHHNPSAGFRSVVNQAFDVPETPQSTTTSVARTNSDTTSTISPIIGGRTLTDERTPTIIEEPHESGSPKATATAVPAFNPGHRRDLSLPSSDNSPSRKPQVTDLDTPTAGHAELSSIPPLQNFSPESPDTGISPQNPSMQPYSNNGHDMPAPLKFGSASGPETFHPEIPTIMGAEESPQNTDNDRLREEIIRSLSREATPSEDPEPSNQTQPQAPAESISRQYEKYWDDQSGLGPNEDPRAMVSESHPDLTIPPPLPSRDPYANSQGATGTNSSIPPPLPSRDPYANSQGVTGNPSSTMVDQPKKPKLERRFSWESSDEEPEPPQIPGSYSSPALATSLSTQEPEPTQLPGSYVSPSTQEPEPTQVETPLVSEVSRDKLTSDDEGSDTQNAAAKPRLSIVPPIPENTTPPEQVMGPGTTPPPPPQIPPRQVSNAGRSSVDESQLLGFRDILGITSINQRIKSFEQTRDQFATIDTGLNHWLQFTVHEHPEHAGVVQQTQSLSPTAPPSDHSRSRFPKLGALGSLGSLNDGTPIGGAHMRRPSAHLGTVMNKEKVGEKGKEFLHTAGAFSGKATGAAKGFFAKGKSRFRPGAGSEKVQSAPNASRRSFQLSFPSGSGEASGNSSLRNSVTLGSLPIFRSERSGLHSDPDPDPQGVSFCLDRQDEAAKDAKATNSGDNYMSHNPVGGTTVQPKQPPSSNDVTHKPEVPQKPAFAGDFEQEMISALGLSPMDSHHRRSASTPMALNASSQVNGGKRQFTEPLPQQGGSTTGNKSEAGAPANKVPVAKKSLPVIPDEPFHVHFPVVISPTHQPTKSTPEIITPSIRPVLNESPKPPSPPPKDHDNGLAPTHDHRRQFSVSTLGADEQPGRASDEELDREPPSPLQATANEVVPKHQSKAEDSVDKASSGPPSSSQQKRRSFVPFYPSEFKNSADVLESKRRSISGLPPSAPEVQSPLRNEVRYSPGTRSSMLSFGSFGKQSASGKGTRPSTPANGISQPSESGSPAESGQSTVEKLKDFGRRRRASVGDLLSGIQPQGPQEPQGPPASPRRRTFSRISGLFGRQASQDPEIKSTIHKRTASEQLQKQYPPTPPSKNANVNISSAIHDEPPVLGNPFEQKPLPTRPPAPTAPPPPPPSDTRPQPRDTRQRTSISLPTSSSSSSLTAGRFYSQFQSGSASETPTSSRHGSTLSQPPPGHSRSPSPMSLHENKAAAPLSSLEKLESHQIHQLQKEEQQKQETQQGTLSENQEKEKHEEHKDRVVGDSLRHELYGEISEAPTNQQNHPDQQHELEGSLKQQSLAPQLSIRSRKPVGSNPAFAAFENNAPRNIAVSSASAISTHPHRSEDKTRVVNDTPQPVELAITADDSSEEIVMSPTSYPGQEWTPMHL